MVRITPSQELGDNVISRLQHRADSWYLRRLIGHKMNKHLTQPYGNKLRPRGLSNFKSKTNHNQPS